MSSGQAGPDLRRLVETKMWWKYVALILALSLLGAFLMIRYDSPFEGRAFATGIFYSVVTALVVSLFYDIGVRRDLANLLHEERRQERAHISEHLVDLVDLDRLPDQQRSRLAQRVSTSESMMTEVSTSLLGSQGHSFYHTWLRPLVEGQVLESVDVEHRLRRFPDRDDLYIMEFRQSFRPAANKRSFVVILTCDNEFYNSLITSGTGVDELVGTPIEDWETIDDQIKNFSFVAYRSRVGKRETRTVGPRHLDAADLAEVIGDRAHQEGSVRGLAYELATDGGWTYAYSYRLTYRISDPYYYWTAVNPMSVGRIVFDYRELKPLVGRVSANCVLGSASGEPHHDMEAGVYTIDVGSLVWPGQGAMLVWRAPDPTPLARQTATDL